MIIAPLVLLLAVQQPADSSAYLDPTARRLVAAARARRETVDRSISAYSVTMKERIGAGVRALRRDRMLYRRELALHIEWRRDSAGSIEVIGARQAIPAVRPRVELPEDLKGDVTDYAFDPADDGITVGFGNGREDHDGEGKDVRLGHPLAPGSEADYRFATGDSSVLAFPDGRTIVLRELRVMPRRLDFNLMTGSLWIDEATHGVVRALFKPARPFDFDEDVGDEDKDIPGFVKPIRGEVRFITIDYGLWDGRWWLPRLIAFDAVATAGSWLQMPLRYELLYSDYTVTGDTTARRAPRPPRATAAADSTARAECHAQADSTTPTSIECQCRNGHCRQFAVHIPTDTAALVGSAELPPAFAGVGDTLISAGEMQDLMHGLGRLPEAPWQFHARPPRWGLARFNRVEGLSLGAKGELDLGRLQLDGLARIATSDGEPDVEGGVTRNARTAQIRLAAYRRLNAVDAAGGSSALGFGNSLGGLLLGRDDGDYYRSAGFGLTVSPVVTAPQTFSVRLYAERQRRAVKRTDFSFPHALHDDHVFRPNVIADSADQLGAAVTLRAQRGYDPAAARWSTEVALDGGAGTYGFSRGSVALRVAAPLGTKVSGALEVAGGTSAGRVPVQSRWYLGGPGTLRGYGGGVISGDAYWRARAEIANNFPAAHVALFCDVGRAGARDHLSLARPLIGVGVGASFLDGLMRIDLGRALRAPKGWRLDLYVDGIL